MILKVKVLNLVYPDKSDIKYKISKFPDGQQQVIIDPTFNVVIPAAMRDGRFVTYPVSQSYNNVSVEIKTRFNSFLDLELVMCSIASLCELGVRDIHLYTPYFIGARSDRKFKADKDGYVGNSYLKRIICPIVNELPINRITVMDPHSYVLDALLNKLHSIDNSSIVKFALDSIYKGIPLQEQAALVAPDAGAGHKIYDLAKTIEYNGEILTCSKERDVQGNLTQCVVPVVKDPTKDLIIIDDICDGGRTFINIADAFKKNGHKGRIFLIVTHGIFSAGFGELSKYFDGIFCTNSYSDVKGFVQQLNIF